MPNIIAPNRTCPECGAKFVAHHGRQAFCTPAHQTAFHDVMKVRGKVMLPLVLTWRNGRNLGQGNKRGRGTAAYAFRELCALADVYAAVDRLHGRRPDLIVAAKGAASWAAADIGGKRKRVAGALAA